MLWSSVALLWVKVLISAYYIAALQTIQCNPAVNCPADCQMSCSKGRIPSLLLQMMAAGAELS